MSRYRKYTDNYLAILEGLRLTENLGGSPLIDTSPCSELDYRNEVLKDKYRATVVELRDPQQFTAETTREYIYEPANYDQYPRYGQGEYDAAFAFWITNLDPDLIKMYEEMGDETYKTYFAFPYIDDSGKPCALSVIRFGHDPTAQFGITHIKNIHLPYEERAVTFICNNDIMSSERYDKMHDAHGEQIIVENDIMRHLRPQIESESVSELVSTLFTTAGVITEENFAQLKARIRHRNVDNRDILIHQVPQFFQIAKKISPRVSQLIQDAYTLNSVNFFEENNYQTFLQYVIQDAQKHNPTKGEEIAEFQALYLEFLVIKLYSDQSNSRQTFIATGVPAQEIRDLMNEYKKVAPKAHTADFIEKINQIYRKIHFNDRITDLKHAIHDSNEPLVRKNAEMQLAWITKLNNDFLNLKPSKQKTAIAFIEQLLQFTKQPNDSYYRTLRQLYPKVRLDPDKLDQIKLNLEIARFNHNISQFKQMLKSCEHPYIRRELAKNVRFLKETLPTFSRHTLEEQMSLNHFLETLNKLPTDNKEHSIDAIEQQYQVLSLPAIPAEERAQLLLPVNIAKMRHEIDKNRYIVDTQGRALVTTLDNSQNNQPILWSLDPNTTAHPELSDHFKQSLSAILQKQQTSALMTGKILELFEKNKTQIVSVQQSLYLFLDHIAQTYQNNMEPEPLLNDDMRNEAILHTLQRLNGPILQMLAQGLAQTCINSRGTVLRKMNPDVLNAFLNDAQDTLREQGKTILIDNLRTQIQNAAPITVIKQPYKPPICFNITESLTTELITTQIKPEYVCYQLKTRSSAPPDFIPSKDTNVLRIQTNALSSSENETALAFQAQFTDRLTDIASHYRFRESTPATYYLYDASPAQIQQTITALHHFNGRSQPIQIAQAPLCLLQIYNVTGSSISLGYPLFSSTTSEITLMYEMTLCQQIARFDSREKIALRPYRDFLNPEPSVFGSLFRSTLFTSSPEGKKTREQIAALKTAWQHKENTNKLFNTQSAAAHALQKLLAFNLHYDNQYAILIQTLSLAIQETALINDESPSQTAAVVALGHAQIFDVAPLPASIQVPLNSLVQATDKSTAIQSANLLMSAMQDYAAQHQNSATLLPQYQQTAKAAQDATSPEDVARTQTHLQTPAPVAKSPTKLHSHQAVSPPRRRKPAPLSHESDDHAHAQNRHRMFTHPDPKQKKPTSVLDKASRNKAAAFKRRSPGSHSGSDSDS